MKNEHTVKAYDSDLNQLNKMIIEMGKKAHRQLEKSIQSMKERNPTVAQEVIDEDQKIDEMEYVIDNFAVRLLALRQPVASDLRQVVAALKISSHLERIADYAVNIAKRVIPLSQTPSVSPIETIPSMASLTQQMILGVLEAYEKLDDEKTTLIWKQDAEVDQMYAGLIRNVLIHMTEQPQDIGPCTHILFMAKHIERIGDHITNIAEVIHFITHGRPFEEPRPKIEEEYS